jgi:hypothetical protein
MKLRSLRRRARKAPMPNHPVTVRVSLRSGDIVVQGKDVQIEAIAASLARAGIELDVTSRGLCG